MKQNIDLEMALKAFKERGIRIDSDEESLEEIAFKNRTTPIKKLTPEEIEAKLAGI